MKGELKTIKCLNDEAKNCVFQNRKGFDFKCKNYSEQPKLIDLQCQLSLAAVSTNSSPQTGRLLGDKLS